MKKIKACVIILNKAGEILLQKRDEKPELGKWVLFGGSVEPGETEIEAAKREIEEELSCKIKKLRFYKRYENNNIEQPIFIADNPIELNELDLHEGLEMKFIPPKYIASLTNIGFNFQEILLDYLKEPDGLAFLKATNPSTKKFHSSRIMFCIKDGKVVTAPEKSTDSHIEWIEKKGWATKENIEAFLCNNPRGFYLPEENKLYCYKGFGWEFDEKLLATLLDNMPQFIEALGINKKTEIHLGPKDAVINGKNYPQKFVGQLGDLRTLN